MTSQHANLVVLVSFAGLETIGLSVFVIMGLAQSSIPSPRMVLEPYVLENIAEFAREFFIWTWIPAGVHSFLFAVALTRGKWWRQPVMMMSISFLVSLAVFGLYCACVNPPWYGIPVYVFLLAASVAPVGSAWIVYRCFLPAARREGPSPG